MVVSVALIVLASSAKPYDARNAFTEIEEIIQLKQEWSLSWLDEHGASNYTVDTRDQLSGDLDISTCRRSGISVENKSVTLQFPKSEWSTSFSLVEQTMSSKHTSSWDPEFPNSIAGFSRWWDGIRPSRKVVL
jgi:hypothetical protein